MIGKSVVALAVAIVLVFVVNALGDIYLPERTLDEPVYRVGLEGGAAAPAQQAAPEPEADIITLISQASADDGARAFRKCTSCHTIDAGGPNRVGPNLHNVVGAEVGHHEGFNYSPALAGHGGTWTYESLDAWLLNPSAYIPGNKMSFAGIKSAQERADLIQYLMANTENPPPPPPPTAPAEEPAAEAAPAEDGEAAPAEGEAAPANGAEAAPANGGEAAPAANGGEAAPAANGGEAAPAAEGQAAPAAQ
ncbi:cytochrome c family protein [Caenispirillum bisanense]|uniref:c-type cytochrome n=1 Tax=Caenispirillum bisanense TaxID=414052 RepID=UPI0031DD179C